MEVPCTCIGILTIVRWEDIPKVRNLLPVGLGPTSNGY